MRVETKDVEIIKSIIHKKIDDARIYLFGSRVDDAKKGGDIDLYVKTSHLVSLKDELNLLTQFELQGINRKVDLIIDSKGKQKDLFFKSIEKEAILL